MSAKICVEATIIGGGVVGNAVAMALDGAINGDILLLEKSPKNALENQSTRNSGVIHAGIYYESKTRPWKARLCAQGNEMLYRYCRRRKLPHRRCGKLVVAKSEDELSHLKRLLAIGQENGVPGLRILDSRQMSELETLVQGLYALYAPSSGVIDSAAYLKTLSGEGRALRLYKSEVVKIFREGEGFRLQYRGPGGEQEVWTRLLVNAAGLGSPSIAKLIDANFAQEFVFVRGESAKFYRTRRKELALQGMNIYPVPSAFDAEGKSLDLNYDEYMRRLEEDSITDTLGVHITPTIDSEGAFTKTMTLGPAITSPVLASDLSKNLKPCEFYRRRVESFFPQLKSDDIQLHQAGIQCRIKGQSDWQFLDNERNLVQLIGIDSPGLTASLAIGQWVANRLAK